MAKQNYATVHKMSWELTERIEKKYKKQIEELEALKLPIEEKIRTLKQEQEMELKKVPNVLCGMNSSHSSGGYDVTCKKCIAISKKNGLFLKSNR